MDMRIRQYIYKALRSAGGFRHPLRYGRSRGRMEQNANEVDGQRGPRFLVQTDDLQMSRAPRKQKKKREGSPKNNVLVGNYRVRRAERSENIPRVSYEVGEM